MYYEERNLIYLDNCETYDLVLSKKLKNFPSGFWSSLSSEEGKRVAVELLRYLIEERFKFDREEILNNLSKEFILNNKLWTPCKLYFGRSAIRYINEAYPNRFKAFEFKKCRIPQNYWCDRNNRKDAIRWLIEENLNWNIDDVKEKFNRDMLLEYDLATLTAYYTSSIDIVNEIYPNQIYVWELKRSSVSPKFWEIKENRLAAVRWLIEEQLKYNHDEVVDKLTIEDFYNNKLTTLIENYYNESISRAVIEAYGDKYMLWEFAYHRWNEEDAKKATVWLIDKLKREKGKDPSEISYYDFQDNKLRIVIDKYYKSSPRKAVLDVGSSIYVS